MIFLGAFFALIGMFFAIVFISVSFAAGDAMFGLIGGGIGILFTIVGGSFLFSNIKAISKKKRILRDGQRITGIIVNVTSTTGVIYNGNPPIAVVVEAEYMGARRTFSVKTGEYDYSKYPVGACVDIAVLGIETAIFKDTIRYIDGVTSQILENQRESLANQNMSGGSIDEGSYTVTVQPDGTYKYN